MSETGGLLGIGFTVAIWGLLIATKLSRIIELLEKLVERKAQP